MTSKYSKFNATAYEVHMLVYERVKEGSKVLDVGCASGYFAKALKRKNCLVWGIEIDKQAAKEAEKHCEKVITGDVECFASEETSSRMTSLSENFFDYILILDVLEHLHDPLSVAKLLSKYVKKNGRVIISVPNIAHIRPRLNLLLGKFDYEKTGIMDEAHLRFFTKKTFKKLVNGAGLRIVDFDYSADFGQLPIVSRYAKKLTKPCQYFLTRLFNTLLSVQFVAICQRKK